MTKKDDFTLHYVRNQRHPHVDQSRLVLVVKEVPGDTVLEELTKARKLRKGLWADPQPGPLPNWIG